MDIQKENKNDAHEFVNGYGYDTPETRQEFEAILASFGESSAHYALRWAADWILNAADASGEQRTKEFAANMAMTFRGVSDLTRST